MLSTSGSAFPDRGSPRYARIPVLGARLRPSMAADALGEPQSGNALRVKWHNHLRGHSHQWRHCGTTNLARAAHARQRIGGQAFTQNASEYLSFCAQRSHSHSTAGLAANLSGLIGKRSSANSLLVDSFLAHRILITVLQVATTGVAGFAANVCKGCPV